MPQGITLTRAEINQRLQDLRNKTALHAMVRQRIMFLEDANKELKKKLTDTEQERDE